jgi:hypothetical protein
MHNDLLGEEIAMRAADRFGNQPLRGPADPERVKRILDAAPDNRDPAPPAPPPHRTVSPGMREIEKRFRAAADALYKGRDATRFIGSYTESRFARAASCLNEAADCMSYALGNVESHMPVEERDAVMAAILSALAGEKSDG